MASFNLELNELKNSTENDGLVAKESQFYPKTFTDPNTQAVRNVHKNTLGEDPKGYVSYPQYNHADIIDAPEVGRRIVQMIEESFLPGYRVR